jgi:hypothetical protein
VTLHASGWRTLPSTQIPRNSGQPLYDPATGEFRPTGSSDTDRDLLTATLLPTGKVLIAGGTAHGSSCTNTAEVYDPESGSFAPTGPMVYACESTATLLKDGIVLLTGGAVRATSDGAELYKP